HRRRPVIKEVPQNLHPVRGELLFDDRVDAVARVRTGLAVRELVLADHLVALEADDELHLSAEIDRAVEAVASGACQLLGAARDLIEAERAAGFGELRLQARAERVTLRAAACGEEALEEADVRVGDRIALRDEERLRDLHL